MTIRKPPGKRLTSLLLSLALLLTLVPAMGTTAAAANEAPNRVAVTINGTSINLDSGDYVETNASSGKKANAATEPSKYVAWYHDGMLTLNGYDGGRIITGSLNPADTTIMLKGSNKVTVDEKECATEITSRGIYHNGGGDLTITGDPGSTLKVDVASRGRAHAIVTNDATVGTSNGTLTIGGSAKVSIHAKTIATSGTAAYGIFVPGGVTIKEDASLDVTCETSCSSSVAEKAPNLGAGILTSAKGTESLTIDTSGTVRLDFSKAANAYSTYVLQTPKVVLTRGRLEMFWRLKTSADEFGYSNAVEKGTTAGTYAERQKKDVAGEKGAAVFVSGTPRTLKLVNAWDAAWTSNGGEVQYVAGEQVTLEPLSIEGVSHKSWKSADGVSISGSTFTMPDKDVTVEGLYEVFAQQPGFKRTYESASNNSGTISFKLNGSPYGSQTALVHENSDDVVVSLTDASVTDGEWTCNVYNNGGNGSVSPGQYRVKVEYGNHTFYSDVFTVKYAAPSASVDDVTVSGSAGTAINETVTITLENDTFASLLSGEWIENLPDGLKQSVTRTDNQTATITIYGVPLVASTAEMKIIIPKGALVDESGKSVGVDRNSSAKFAITSSYPTADKIVIGGTAFPNGNSYYKNGTDGAFGGFTGTALDYNAKYDPQTGTLTLNGYNGPYIRINGGDGQTVTVKLEGTDNTVKGDYDPAIQLNKGVNLIITSDEPANLTLDVTDAHGIGALRGVSDDSIGSVTLAGKANVTIKVSIGEQSYSGIRGGKDVAVLGDASLKITCGSTAESTSVWGYGIYFPSGSGMFTVDTNGTVEIDVLGCANSNTYCIYANNIAFKNAEKITLKYVPSGSWYPSEPTYGTIDASGMKSPKTVPTDKGGNKIVGEVTTVTYAKLGAPPAKPEIRTDKDPINLTQPMEVKLSCKTPGVVIYYTTDDSDPKDSSSTREEYDAAAPFEVKKTCTVRAVAYSEEDRLYSEVASKLFKWKEYDISFASSDGNGKAYDERNKVITQAEAGAKIYLKADETISKPLVGKKVFSGWTVKPETVSIENSGSYNGASFTMPAGNVTVRATYTDAPAGVTVSGTVTSYNGKNDFTVTLYEAGTKIVKHTATVSGNGNSGQVTQDFSIASVAADTYDLVVTKPGHLTYTIKNVVVGSSDVDLTAHTNAKIKLITLLAGDVNGDGSINLDDFVPIQLNFMKKGTLSADITGDSVVNLDDFVLIQSNFMKSSLQCIAVYEEV